MRRTSTQALSDFTVEDLRIMLGQEIAVPLLLPRAVDVLLREPLAGGDLHPGDLLRSVLRLPDSAWSKLYAQRQRLADVVRDLVAGAELHDREPGKQIADYLNATPGAGGSLDSPASGSTRWG